ncbi:MAG: hypothetical protein ABI759_02685 [Candidatus Solibacter sp.]
MEVLRRSFLADGSRQVRRLAEFASTRFDIGGATRMFHQWVGSAGALGYMELAEKARAAEILLTVPGWAPSDLRDALVALSQAFLSPREASDTLIPDAIMLELSRKRVALIGFADEEAERLCSAFERARALPRLFTGEEPPQSDPIRDCKVVMIHVRPETLNIRLAKPRGGAAQPPFAEEHKITTREWRYQGVTTNLSLLPMQVPACWVIDHDVVSAFSRASRHRHHDPVAGLVVFKPLLLVLIVSQLEAAAPALLIPI